MSEHPVLKHFERKEHSKMWPSSDPKDKPFSTYTCKGCGWEYTFVSFGQFPMGANPERDAIEVLRDHLLFDHFLETVRSLSG